MKVVFGIIFYYVMTCLAGFSFRRCLKFRQEILSLEWSCSFIVGSLAIYVAQMYISIFNLHIDFFMMILLFLPCVAWALLMSGYQSHVESSIKVLDFFEKNRLLLLLIFVEIVVTLMILYIRPVSLNDDFSNFSGNSKRLFFRPVLDTFYFQNANHSDYPLWIMLQQVYLSQCMGYFDDFICKLPNYIFFLHVFCVAVRFSFSRAHKQWAYICISILITLPFYMRIAFDSTGEIMMSLSIGLCVITLLDRVEIAKNFKICKNSLVLMALPAVLKAEGFYTSIFLILISAFFVASDWRSRLQDVFAHICVFLFVYVPFACLKYMHVPKDSRISEFDMSHFFDVDHLWQLLSQIEQFMIPGKALLVLPLLGISFWLASVLKHRSVFKNQPLEHQYMTVLTLGISCIYALGCVSVGWVSEYGRLLTHLTWVIWIYILLNEPHRDGRSRSFWKKNSV